MSDGSENILNTANMQQNNDSVSGSVHDNIQNENQVSDLSLLQIKSEDDNNSNLQDGASDSPKLMTQDQVLSEFQRIITLFDSYDLTDIDKVLQFWLQ